MPSTPNKPKYPGRGRPRKDATPLSRTPMSTPGEKRKVGRPPLSVGTSSTKARTPNVVTTPTMCSRRSKRYRMVDPYKELVVLRPKDNPEHKFDLDPREVDEFKACMKELVDYGEDSGSDSSEEDVGISHEGLSMYFSAEQRKTLDGRNKKKVSNKVVHTPSVVLVGNDLVSEQKIVASSKSDSSKKERKISVVANSQMPMKAEGSRPLLYSQICSTNVGHGKQYKYHYGEYDIDSDDEEFIDAANAAFNRAHYKVLPRRTAPTRSEAILTVDCFETMIAAIERQLRFEMTISSTKTELRSLYDSCELSLESAAKTAKSVESLLLGLTSLTATTSSADSVGAVTTNNGNGRKRRRSNDIASDNDEAFESRVGDDERCVLAYQAVVDSLSKAQSAGETRIEERMQAAITAFGKASPQAIKLSNTPKKDSSAFEVQETIPSHSRGLSRKRPLESDSKCLSSTVAPVASIASKTSVSTPSWIPIFDPDSLRLMVPFSVSRVTLDQILRYYCGLDPKISTQLMYQLAEKDGAGLEFAWNDGVEDSVSAMLESIYEYWIRLRAYRKTSLLRCYHQYLMRNWKEDIASLVDPVFPSDVDLSCMLEAKLQMISLRKDLDRARLIVDRVRRRERLKRDLARVSMESIGLVSINGQEPNLRIDPSIFLCFQQNVEDDAQCGIIRNDEDKLNTTQNFERTASTPKDSSRLSSTLLSLGNRSMTPSVGGPLNRHDLSGFSRPLSSDASHIWTRDLDRLLLMGVATCGIKRWLQVREEFGFGSDISSKQLQDRFMVLASERYDQCSMRENHAPEQVVVHEKQHVGVTERKGGASWLNEVPQQVITGTGQKINITKRVAAMLASFNEDMMWDRITIRLLMDGTFADSPPGPNSQSDDTHLYPKLKIPERFQQNRHSKYRYMLLKVPTLLSETEVSRFIATSMSRSSNEKLAVNRLPSNGTIPAGPLIGLEASAGGDVTDSDSDSERKRGRPAKYSSPLKVSMRQRRGNIRRDNSNLGASDVESSTGNSQSSESEMKLNQTKRLRSRRSQEILSESDISDDDVIADNRDDEYDTPGLINGSSLMQMISPPAIRALMSVTTGQKYPPAARSRNPIVDVPRAKYLTPSPLASNYYKVASSTMGLAAPYYSDSSAKRLGSSIRAESTESTASPPSQQLLAQRGIQVYGLNAADSLKRRGSTPRCSLASLSSTPHISGAAKVVSSPKKPWSIASIIGPPATVSSSAVDDWDIDSNFQVSGRTRSRSQSSSRSSHSDKSTDNTHRPDANGERDGREHSMHPRNYKQQRHEYFSGFILPPGNEATVQTQLVGRRFHDKHSTK